MNFDYAERSLDKELRQDGIIAHTRKLNAILTEISDIVDALKEKLDPILSPSIPAIPTPSIKDETTERSSDLQELISTIGGQAQNVASNLQTIINRIAL